MVYTSSSYTITSSNQLSAASIPLPSKAKTTAKHLSLQAIFQQVDRAKSAITVAQSQWNVLEKWSFAHYKESGFLAWIARLLLTLLPASKKRFEQIANLEQKLDNLSIQMQRLKSEKLVDLKKLDDHRSEGSNTPKPSEAVGNSEPNLITEGPPSPDSLAEAKALSTPLAIQSTPLWKHLSKGVEGAEYLNHLWLIDLNLIQYDPQHFCTLNQKLRENPLFMAAAVKKNGLIIHWIDKHIANYDDLALAAIKQNAKAMNLVSEHLKNNFAFVKVAVSLDGCCLKFASPAMQDDPEIALIAVKQNGNALLYTSPLIRKNLTIVTAAIQQNGFVFTCLDQELQLNAALALVAVKQNEKVLSDSLPETLLADPTFILNALEHTPLALKHAPPAIQRDKKVALFAVSHHAKALKYAANELQADKEVVLAAVKKSGKAIIYASERLRDKDIEIALAAVQQDKEVFRLLCSDLQNTPEIQKAYLAQDVPERGLT